MSYRFTAEVWKYAGESAWHFVTLPVDVADDIRERTEDIRRGFGSVRVRATVGTSTWSTSVFPEKASGSYVLPVKQQVRKAQDLADGDPAEVTLELLEA